MKWYQMKAYDKIKENIVQTVNYSTFLTAHDMRKEGKSIQEIKSAQHNRSFDSKKAMQNEIGDKPR